MKYPDVPRVAVGVLVLRGQSAEREVLLVRRSKPPHNGVWAVPGGAVELGETLEQAAEREVLEETSVSVRALGVVYAFDAIERDAARRISYHYVVVDLLAECLEGEPVAGDDAADACWMRLDDMRRLPREALSDETRSLVLRHAGE
jgi:ADP-ribose pyrophosphatase